MTSASPVQCIRPEAASAAGRMSPGRASGGHSPGKFPGREFDMLGFRRVFRDRWADFLRTHFRNSIEVALTFDVDDKTARQWMSGANAPSGHAAVYAVDKFPAALPILMGRAA